MNALGNRLAAVLLLVFAVVSSARALDKNDWDDISNVGALSLMGAAVITPTAKGDWDGLGQAALSIGSAGALAEVLKQTFPERRPDNSDNKSFPSGHTALSFASATTLHRRYGWQAGLPAYALATVVGIGRERSNEHHWYDVVAGAALGTASGWLFTDAFNDKVKLVPWADSKGGGVIVAVTW
ncbi:MAG: phosphatase PAP2 family protein [Gammaproteobacteria bacterium HGW-Gammaproteobacteria-4]|jgi:membrane-associated phospholipid phosphatase|nr:MAG: phosphatase PAP2 family protein [Gammaproteobacteria bacterium HGW-Gammaproteobacteria-4]